MRISRSEKHYVCPRCGYNLAPVHARKDARREPIGYCCPEPYCDYVMLTVAEPRSRVETDRRPATPEVCRAS